MEGTGEILALFVGMRSNILHSRGLSCVCATMHIRTAITQLDQECIVCVCISQSRYIIPVIGTYICGIPAFLQLY